MGDLHGRYDLFTDALKKINFDSETDQVYILGDVTFVTYKEYCLEFLTTIAHSKRKICYKHLSHLGMNLQFSIETTDHVTSKDKAIQLVEEDFIKRKSSPEVLRYERKLRGQINNDYLYL